MNSARLIAAARSHIFLAAARPSEGASANVAAIASASSMMLSFGHDFAHQSQLQGFRRADHARGEHQLLGPGDADQTAQKPDIAASGDRPILRCTQPIRRDSPAMMKSQASAIDRPMPSATPRTAPIRGFSIEGKTADGLVHVPRLEQRAGDAALGHLADVGARAEIVPAPVRIATRISLSSLMRSASAAISSRIASSMAFFLSGRLRVTTATPFSTLNSMEHE